MMEEVKNRRINCIIVKDLSRFGRNYIEAGKYLEQVFPFLGVRFIAITDDMDTGRKQSDAEQFILPALNIRDGGNRNGTKKPSSGTGCTKTEKQ